MRLLIDECLSPALVALAHAAGHEAAHVIHLSLREGHRAGRGVEAVGFEFGDGGEPLVLVHRVAGEQEAQHFLDAGVVGQGIEARDLQAALARP